MNEEFEKFKDQTLKKFDILKDSIDNLTELYQMNVLTMQKIKADLLKRIDKFEKITQEKEINHLIKVKS